MGSNTCDILQQVNSWSDTEEPGMGYERFSVDPLRALNEETRLRIVQLESDLKPVIGKSVLDIGCHAGLGSVMSLQLGAASVYATDVSPKFLKPLKDWGQLHALPLEVESIGFANLGSQHRREVVVFFEVYHWLADQGWSAMAVAERLNEVTESVILIESPWDSSDPSIARSKSEYSAKYELYELLKYLVWWNFEVTFVGMCSYFGNGYSRARFICKRKALTVQPGDAFQHKVGKDSPLLKLHDRGHQLLLNISTRGVNGLWPIWLPNSSVYQGNTIYYSKALEGSKSLAEHPKPHTYELLSRAWEAVKQATIGLREFRQGLTLQNLPTWPELWTTFESVRLKRDQYHCLNCRRWIELIITPGATTLMDSLVHGDVHQGNLLVSGENLTLIDLENIHLGPAFTDIFLFSLLTAGANESLPQIIAYLAELWKRPPVIDQDLKHALSIALIQRSISRDELRDQLDISIHQTLKTISRMIPLNLVESFGTGIEPSH